MSYLVTVYSFFAILATFINIGTQDLVVRLYSGPLGIYIAVLFGTLTGLLVKYTLDKQYIFQYQTHSLSHNTRTFIFYSMMGLMTTLIFWAFEFGFGFFFHTKMMRYLGAILGLAIGYVIKYNLDKAYVFCKVEA